MCVLLVSSDAGFLGQLRSRLALLQWSLREAHSGAEALEMLHSYHQTDVLLLDPALPDLLPAELCGLVQHSFPRLEILTVELNSGNIRLNSAGSTSTTTKIAELLSQGTRSSSVSSPARTSQFMQGSATTLRLPGVIGESTVMQQAYSLTQMVAARDTTVLITGESGTGKDLIAHAVHKLSPRSQAPFVVVNCAAIPEALLEAELFGYAKGAFTGAMQSRIGRIHAAHGGTLFLDEIGEMPLPLQGKILRFVEQGEVQRLGSNDNLRVDVRVVTATNAPLQKLVKERLFREDLYFRLAVFPIRLAPLREREKDVTLLAHFFAARFAPGVSLTSEAIEELYKHDWPGNVRELRNVIERASILAGGARALTSKHIMI